MIALWYIIYAVFWIGKRCRTCTFHILGIARIEWAEMLCRVERGRSKRSLLRVIIQKGRLEAIPLSAFWVPMLQYDYLKVITSTLLPWNPLQLKPRLTRFNDLNQVISPHHILLFLPNVKFFPIKIHSKNELDVFLELFDLFLVPSRYQHVH